ncbi:MAG: bifunctional 2-polyprenyl-6-hydroxyphenol methylase/3-demethylubiquinol 3-O-methyltransferase UbiG [Cyanobacteria bacterium P01_C01_bin.118]
MERNNLAFYDQQAAQWWTETATIFALNKMNPLRFKYFDRVIPRWQGLRVLDVGCGGGYTCEFLARRGAIVTGIDQSAACIEVAKRHSLAMELTIDYRVGVGENLAFEDNGFDVVICVDVLEHVESPKATVTEIGRVLKPGGLFCFDTISRTWQSRWMMIWLLENVLRQIPQGIHDWRKFVRPEELDELLLQAGFAKATMEGFDLFGRNPLAQITNLMHFWKTGGFRVRFDEDTRVMYIGTAQWVKGG